jgi:hypothetical protein
MKIDKKIREKIKQIHKKRVGKDAWNDFNIEKDTDAILDDVERLCK